MGDAEGPLERDQPPARATAAPEAARARVERVARRAFALFQRGWATGDFGPYLAMCRADFAFAYPSGAHRGRVTGTEGYRRMVAKCQEEAASGQRLQLSAPTRVTTSETTAVIEFDVEGWLGRHYYRGWTAISFDVAGEQLSGFREYFGDADADRAAAEALSAPPEP
jgi:hypothetical protein